MKLSAVTLGLIGFATAQDFYDGYQAYDYPATTVGTTTLDSDVMDGARKKNKNKDKYADNNNNNQYNQQQQQNYNQQQQQNQQYNQQQQQQNNQQYNQNQDKKPTYGNDNKQPDPYKPEIGEDAVSFCSIFQVRNSLFSVLAL